MNEQKFIVCYGNPVDGFVFVGPFVCADDAAWYMAGEKDIGSMWVIPLNPPHKDKP